MARIRSVHPGLFTDEAFVSLSMTARVLYIGIWTEADDHGIFEWKPLQFKMRLMPADPADIAALMEEMATCNCVKKFTSEGKSYGLVRNFCRYQRPKKPKYTFHMPQELHTYAGLRQDGSSQVLHQSGTSSEKSPQMEDGGGEGEEESGIGIEKGEGVKPARSDLKLVGEEKPTPIDINYGPSEPAIEYAFSLGMKAVDLKSELSKFIARSLETRAVSFNPDMSFKVWCDRWLDFKRKKDPDWKPTPEPVAASQEPYVLVIQGTTEAVCWDAYNRDRGLRWLFFSKHIVNGAEAVAARCKTLFPPGYDEATGERIAPPESENAA
jgi:hypothetical protein